MRNLTLEVDGDGDKTLVIFDEPNDVKGTAFLNYTHREGSDDQWLYLPALRRVKRIASNNKSGPFMGSEFAYEDISSQEVEKYTYEFLRAEDVEGTSMYVVQRVPVDERSGYTRQIVWYDQAEYRVQRVDFYDRKDELMKTTDLSRIRAVSRPVLAGCSHGDGEPPDRKEHLAGVDRLRVPNRSVGP